MAVGIGPAHWGQIFMIHHGTKQSSLVALNWIPDRLDPRSLVTFLLPCERLQLLALRTEGPPRNVAHLRGELGDSAET